MSEKTKVTEKAAPAETPKSKTTAPAQKSSNVFVRMATWLLARLPWFKTRYQNWSNTKRLWIGLPLYIVVLPIIPLAIAIIWYVRDPEGFKKSKFAPVLGAIIVVWFGAFGVVAFQQPTPDVPTDQNAAISDGILPSENPADQKQALEKVKNQTVSNATGGRQFKNCTEAFQAGVFNIKKSDKAYQEKLDRDKDGIACEK